MAKIFEVTYIDAPGAPTVRLNTRQAHKVFGRSEWLEVLAGYLPHIVAIEVTAEVGE